ncbi:neuferricin isoform X2 [Belonocnema kinseyi]|uniref:neuferricin isoform X2 n=1 Tax=Belonocnema kinseyi TaxID=2817044 RepID=UPI00143E0773|nr:neuferricin isoform X2 [Belonocnema kinseyi]
MFTRYIWLLLLFWGAYVLLSNNYYVELVEKYLTKFLDDFSQVINENEEIIVNNNGNKGEERIWTREELEKFRTLEKGLYLAILGQVFDVTKGEKHYAPGETYHPFTEEGLIDDISSLSAQQTKALNGWVDFYTKTYSYQGKLVGNFYNSDGTPAAGFYNLQEKLKEAEQSEFRDAKKNQIFPPCNIEWQLDTGTRVWCTTSSGGIHRDWVGVPRMFFENPTSKQHRCVCVNLDSKDFKENQGNFREFNECLTDSSSCVIKIENE